jgi:hypothetical protein
VVPNLEVTWDPRAVWSFAGRLTAVAESAVGHSAKPLLTIHSIRPRRDQQQGDCIPAKLFKPTPHILERLSVYQKEVTDPVAVGRRGAVKGAGRGSLRFIAEQPSLGSRLIGCTVRGRRGHLFARIACDGGRKRHE